MLRLHLERLGFLATGKSVDVELSAFHLGQLLAVLDKAPLQPLKLGIQLILLLELLGCIKTQVLKFLDLQLEGLVTDLERLLVREDALHHTIGLCDLLHCLVGNLSLLLNSGLG